MPDISRSRHSSIVMHMSAIIGLGPRQGIPRGLSFEDIDALRWHLIARLAATNWLRTAAWTVRAVVLAAQLQPAFTG